jgi:chromosome segregation ATPase
MEIDPMEQLELEDSARKLRGLRGLETEMQKEIDKDDDVKPQGIDNDKKEGGDEEENLLKKLNDIKVEIKEMKSQIANWTEEDEDAEDAYSDTKKYLKELKGQKRDIEENLKKIRNDRGVGPKRKRGEKKEKKIRV